MSISIGIDIGGTKIAFGLVDEFGTILLKMSFLTPRSGRSEVLSIIKEGIHSLMKKAEMNEWGKVIGIGIGTAGQIDFKQGCVLSGTTNIQDWNNVPLKSVIENMFDVPVWVDNDVNVILLAEKYLGAAQGENDVVCLALGTGVGGAVISGGEFIRGSWGAAAELGHISLDMNGPLCNCGFRGCLEVFASGTGIARMMKEQLALNNTDISKDIIIETVTSESVFELYQQGNQMAISVIETMLNALSFGIVNLIHTFNPTTLILGGGVMKNGGWILASVKERVARIGLRSMIDPVHIVRAKLGSDSGLIGAAYQSFVYKNQLMHSEGIE